MHEEATLQIFLTFLHVVLLMCILELTFSILRWFLSSAVKSEYLVGRVNQVIAITY